MVPMFQDLQPDRTNKINTYILTFGLTGISKDIWKKNRTSVNRSAKPWLSELFGFRSGRSIFDLTILRTSSIGRPKQQGKVQVDWVNFSTSWQLFSIQPQVTSFRQIHEPENLQPHDEKNFWFLNQPRNEKPSRLIFSRDHSNN